MPVIKPTMEVAVKFVIRETRSTNALVNLDLFWKVIQLVRKVSYDVPILSEILSQTGYFYRWWRALLISVSNF